MATDDCNSAANCDLDFTDRTCRPFQLTDSCKDTKYIDNLVGEHLNIGGADVNVFPLLGIHEQGLLVDLAGSGVAISGGDGGGSTPDAAFVSNPIVWQSSQVEWYAGTAW